MAFMRAPTKMQTTNDGDLRQITRQFLLTNNVNTPYVVALVHITQGSTLVSFCIVCRLSIAIFIRSNRALYKHNSLTHLATVARILPHQNNCQTIGKHPNHGIYHEHLWYR